MPGGTSACPRSPPAPTSRRPSPSRPRAARSSAWGSRVAGERGDAQARRVIGERPDKPRRDSGVPPIRDRSRRRAPLSGGRSRLSRRSAGMTGWGAGTMEWGGGRATPTRRSAPPSPKTGRDLGGAARSRRAIRGGAREIPPRLRGGWRPEGDGWGFSVIPARGGGFRHPGQGAARQRRPADPGSLAEKGASFGGRSRLSRCSAGMTGWGAGRWMGGRPRHPHPALRATLPEDGEGFGGRRDRGEGFGGAARSRRAIRRGREIPPRLRGGWRPEGDGWGFSVIPDKGRRDSGVPPIRDRSRRRAPLSEGGPGSRGARPG